MGRSALKPGLEPPENHIIERPRLMRLLEQAQSRVIMLVAPAGYGKTILARQWVERKAHAWYNATPASADVAALVLGLADVLADSRRVNLKLLRDRLKATREPETDVTRLVDLFASLFSESARNTWIVFDDYQALASSRAAEEFVRLMIERTHARVLLTTRSRPRWAGAREILYGEVYELGQTPLAMNEEEAQTLLSNVGEGPARGLAALSQGWPAVLGLAAHSQRSSLPATDLPTALYEFFADELYSRAQPSVRRALVKFSLLPTTDREITREILGDEADWIISESVQLGFAVHSELGDIRLHPLVREFLRRRSTSLEQPSAAEVNRIVDALTKRKKWDDAFSVVEAVGTGASLVSLIRVALRQLLDEGRLSTLDRWLNASRERGVISPVLDLAKAEVAFRRNQDREAEALALQAGRSLRLNDPLRGRSFYIAGQAARQGERVQESLKNFQLAERFAVTQNELREALWGQFIAHCGESEEPAAQVLRKLEELEPSEPSDLIRMATAYEVMDVRSGIGLRRPLEAMAAAHPLTKQVDDPVVVTAFLNGYSRCLSMASDYRAALAVANEHIEAGIKYRLEFVLSPGYTARALAALGRGDFTRATRLLARSRSFAREQHDTHNQFEIAAVQMRVLIAQREFEDALEVEPPEGFNRISSGMRGEWLACRALALAGAGGCAEAESLADQALSTTASLETAGVAGAAKAILRAKEDNFLSPEAEEWLKKIIEWRYLDALLLATRAYPPLVASLHQSEMASELLEMLRRADSTVVPAGPEDKERSESDDVLSLLSKRELEVCELLSRGMTNREIAHALFISETTVKVHVRHIFKKLGVRSRTEVALVGATLQLQ